MTPSTAELIAEPTVCVRGKVGRGEQRGDLVRSVKVEWSGGTDGTLTLGIRASSCTEEGEGGDE